MGERSMNDCVSERLDSIRDAIRHHGTCGYTVSDWYDDGALIGELTSGVDDETDRNDTVEAWGYLTGVADCLDLTVREMLDHYGLSFDEPYEAPVFPPKRKAKVARRKRAS